MDFIFDTIKGIFDKSQPETDIPPQTKQRVYSHANTHWTEQGLEYDLLSLDPDSPQYHSSALLMNNFNDHKTYWNSDARHEQVWNLEMDQFESNVFYPARFTGYLEDSSALYRDVYLAAEETGVSPEFLYVVAMQEGLAMRIGQRTRFNKGEEVRGFSAMRLGIHTAQQREQGSTQVPIYGGVEEIFDGDHLQIPLEYHMDSFTDIGLDMLNYVNEEAVNLGILDVAIQPGVDEYGDPYEEWRTVTNEAGDDMHSAQITEEDALRGTGVIIRMNERYLKSKFENQGYDWDNLDQKNKNFWLYAAFNAGAGTASKLARKWGPNILDNEEFLADLKNNHTETDGDDVWIADGSKFGEWMFNVMRVVGATEVMEEIDPWKINE